MLVYGEYCSNLPVAQKNIEVACMRDKTVAEELEVSIYNSYIYHLKKIFMINSFSIISAVNV